MSVLRQEPLASLRLVGLALLMGGCATAQSWVDFYRGKEPPVPDYHRMTYIQILNYEAKRDHPPVRNRRRVMFYGRASEKEQRVGIKVTIPF